jgi:SAM-dependent methyltransferase
MNRKKVADDPSSWVARFASLIPPDGDILDVACGGGRHTRFFLDQGHRVVAVDVNASGVSDLAGHPLLEIIQTDLEHEGRPPFAGRRFGGVIVTNYLHRPLLADLVSAVAPGGVLIYETYAEGQQRFGRPANPDFLLRTGELLEMVKGKLRVVAFEDMVVDELRPAAIQRICAVRDRPEAPAT